MNYKLEVENIKCSGCANSIKNAMLKIEGVEEVSVDVENEIVNITGSTEKEVLMTALSKLGYPERGNNALLKKAKSYVSCAIGKMDK